MEAAKETTVLIEISFLENQETGKQQRKCFSYHVTSVSVVVLTGSCYVSQAGLQLAILLPQLLECSTLLLSIVSMHHPEASLIC